MNDQLAAIEFDRSNEALLVRVSGEIDLSNSQQVHQQLENAVEGWAVVVIDLTDVRYLDSQGLRVIKQLCTALGKNGGELRLVAPPGGFARQVLDMGRMSDYAEIRDALEG